MARVQVIGAGECGLPLALRLARDGQDVSLVADRGAEAVLANSVTSTQVKFGATLQVESESGLGHWRDSAPPIRGIRFSVVADRVAVLEWSGHLSIPAQSVDQRTVFARWLDDYLAVGGHLEIADPTVSYVDHGAARHDLTVVTRASAELNACFPTDLRWPQVRAPLRRLSVLYLDGVTAEPEELGTYVTVVSHGEVISYAGLTGTPGHERRCEMLLFEARPGGALDLFRSDSTAGERLRLALRLLHHHLPASLSERYRGAELTDSGGTLVGAVHPSMHHPVGTLPSGALVLGGGDVVCRMDPGGAQGANSAAQCAQHYSDAISSTPAGGCFDRAWMDATAEPWLREVAHPAARWTTTVLDPPPSMQSLIFAARHDSTLADLFADTFAQPTHRSRFITDDDT